MIALRRRHVSEAVERRCEALHVATALRRRDDLLEEVARELEVAPAFAAFAMLLFARSTAVTSPSCSQSAAVSPKSVVASAHRP